MGYKSKAFAGERVALSADYWAQVKPMTGDEALAMAEAATSDEGKSLSNRASLVLLLTTAVAAWNLDDDDGNLLQINEATVGELSAADQMRLVQASRRLNNPLADAETKGN